MLGSFLSQFGAMYWESSSQAKVFPTWKDVWQKTDLRLASFWRCDSDLVADRVKHLLEMTLKTDHRAHFSYLGGACLDPCHLW
jgi:hypothetical protein